MMVLLLVPQQAWMNGLPPKLMTPTLALVVGGMLRLALVVMLPLLSTPNTDVPFISPFRIGPPPVLLSTAAAPVPAWVRLSTWSTVLPLNVPVLPVNELLG